jgi:hypothetical protein
MRRKKPIRLTRRLAALLAAALIASAGATHAAEELSDSDKAKANDPLASATAFNVHNYYIGEVTGTDEPGNQFWLRVAQPFSIGKTSWLMRASLPVNTYPVQGEQDTDTGLGDLNAFAAYLIDLGKPRVSFGVGPLIAAPTATNPALGSGKWSAGFMNILFNGTSPRFQWGYLLTWQTSFAGDDDRDGVNVGAFQPLLIWQLGRGTYLRATPIMTYDFEHDTYDVPLGLGVGQVWKRGTTTFNLFVEPQWSAAYEGAGWPEWQVFLGFNTIFK